MMRALRLKGCLEATLQNAEHAGLDKTPRMANACTDVLNHNVWNAMYVVCGVCHGAILTLRYSDSNEPCMDKVFMWAYRTCVYIKKHEAKINEVELFIPDRELEEDGEFSEELKEMAEPGKA